jgi:hypothetical protein
VRHNPALKAFRERRAGRGERPKVILTAVARRLLVIANAITRSGRPWQAELAAALSAAGDPAPIALDARHSRVFPVIHVGSCLYSGKGTTPLPLRAPSTAAAALFLRESAMKQPASALVRVGLSGVALAALVAGCPQAVERAWDAVDLPLLGDVREQRERGRHLEVEQALTNRRFDVFHEVLAGVIEGRLRLREGAERLLELDAELPPRLRLPLDGRPGRCDTERACHYLLDRVRGELEGDPRAAEVLVRLNGELAHCFAIPEDAEDEPGEDPDPAGCGVECGVTM